MAGTILKLKFEDKGAGLVAGCAWVTCAGAEITPDCASFGELDCRLRELEDDIASIRKAAKKEFDRLQGGQHLPRGPKRPEAKTRDAT